MRNDYIQHGWFKKGQQRDKHKYVARIETGDPKNPYRYFYTWPEWLAYKKQETKDKIADAVKNRDKIASKALNKVAEAGNKLYDKVVTSNKYITDDYSIDKKKEQVKQTQEWKDIVKRKDPEYVKYNKESGQYEADLDSYLAKKKHPGLDAMDDFIAGREISVNKVTKESAIAGAYDYAKTYIQLAAIGTEFMLEKFKFSQGSYREEKQQMKEELAAAKKKATTQYNQYNSMMSDPATQQAISEGQKYINEYAKAVQNVNMDTNKLQSQASQYVSSDDIKKAKDEYDRAQEQYTKAMKELQKYEASQRKKEEEEKKKNA